MRQLSDQILACAFQRIEAPVSVRTEADLRRATSDLYYAMFHAICGAMVEPLQADIDNQAFRDHFVAIYRQADHGQVERRCRASQNDDHAFPQDLKDFGKELPDLKNKREKADYHPLAQLDVSEVKNDFRRVQANLARFWASDHVERARFARFLVFKRP